MKTSDSRADRLLARVAALEASDRKLRAKVEGLIAWQGSTERALGQGMVGVAPPFDPDRVLNLEETAAAIGKAAPTVRHWIADAHLFERHFLAALLRKDSSGRWVSSPRLVARYKQVAFRSLCELAR